MELYSSVKRATTATLKHSNNFVRPFRMMQLDEALRAWGTSDFESVLKQEIAHLGADHLPLQQGLSGGNYVTNDPISVAIHSVTEMEYIIRISAGIFYQGVMGGCSCADDPTPTSETNEYCTVQLDIDKNTALTTAMLINE